MIDLVYIDDVIEGYSLVAKRLMDNKVSNMEEYVISSGNPILLRELVSIYGQNIGNKLPIKWGGRSYRPREVTVSWNQGQKIPGWKPQYDLITGLKKVIEREVKKKKQSSTNN